MITPECPRWQGQRSEFNHQWLKNRFLSALDTAANVISGRIRLPGFLEELIGRTLREWEVRRVELAALIDTCEDEMSPRVLFDSPPLCGGDPASRAALRAACHGLWLARSGVREHLRGVRRATAAVDDAYRALVACA